MEREQHILELSAVTLLVAVAVLVLTILHRRHLQRITKQLDTSIPIGEGLELKKVVEEQQEMTRQHVSAELDTVRGNTQVTKSRMEDVYSLMKRMARAFGINL